MAAYHILIIDSLLETLTLCNTGKGFRFQLPTAGDIVATPNDIILGYVTSPIDAIKYVFEVESTSLDAIILNKQCEVSKGLHFDIKSIPELHPVAYTKGFVTITEDTFIRIIAELRETAFGRINRVIGATNTSTTQTIYYGCPGTGKSFEVKMIAEGKHGEKTIWYEKATNNDKSCRKIDHVPSEEEKKLLDNNIFRTTFHPDYDYATFVGCYKPLKNDDGKLDYRFIPQVFTNAYVSALRHPDDPTYLIIEEINRGNCAQIFGDLFQLLDRSGGESDYEIKPDTELAKYLASEGVPSQSLKLPDNLHIYATMNTSDQSLFPMDSAFKRRWAMEYKPIDYKHGKAMKFTLTIDSKEYPWIGFLQMVNEMILNATDSEDKQMGEFFIKSSITEKEFVNKVMFYLWNDICKDLYNPRRVQAAYFLRVKDKLEEEKNDYFTFAELFSERNENSRLINEFILYLEDKFKDNHKDILLTEDKRIDWKTIIEKTVPTPGTE